jgi:hypothetical protein
MSAMRLHPVAKISRLPARERPQRLARGYVMGDLCRLEGVNPRTNRRWVAKGVLAVDRLAPGLGVRYRYVDPRSDPFSSVDADEDD